MIRKKIFGIPVVAASMRQTINFIDEAVKSGKNLQHVVVNAGKIVSMQSDSELRKSVLEADIINADGQAVVWASKFLGQGLPERVAGIDLMVNLIELCYQKGYKCYFFGAKECVVKKVVETYALKYSKLIIAGYRNGYFSEDEEEKIVEDIRKSGANMLFVALSSPKKEIFINKYKDIIDVPFVMGVGGSFDVIAGLTKRAPFWMQRFGIEWFYRLIQEPKRLWKRYLIGNYKFVLLVLKERFRKG